MTILPDNFQLARVLAQKLFPYWQQLLWSLEPVERPGLGTVATDRHWRLYFDRDEVAKWPVDYALVALLHEVVHITNRHHVRGTADDNVAADMAVNCWLEELFPAANYRLHELQIALKLKSPDDWIHPNSHGFPRCLALEDYRELLNKQPHPNPTQGLGSGQAGKPVPAAGKAQPGEQSSKSDDGPTPAPGANQADKSDEDNKNGAGSGEAAQDSQKPQLGKGRCGSCAHKENAPWEDPSPQEGGAPGLSEPEMDVRIQQVAQAVREYGQKYIGRLPAFMSRWAERELRPPTIPWTRELAAAARAALQMACGATQRSWRKLNRRSAVDILFPGMQHPIPSLAMIVDVSGSMSEQNVQDALSEAQGVLREVCYTPVPVLAVDAAVNACKKVCDMRRMPLVGGGGTDMRLGIQAALELKPKPQVIILFTDGWTPFPDEPIPGIKLIVVLVCKGAKVPDWIRTIEVEAAGAA